LYYEKLLKNHGGKKWDYFVNNVFIAVYCMFIAFLESLLKSKAYFYNVIAMARFATEAISQNS
jgi:hypothetical protein